MHILFNAGGETVTTRVCLPVALASTCERGSYQGLSGTVCYCQTNLCNTATHGAVISGIAMTAAAGLAIALAVVARL